MKTFRVKEVKNVFIFIEHFKGRVKDVHELLTITEGDEEEQYVVPVMWKSETEVEKRKHNYKRKGQDERLLRFKYSGPPKTK